MDHTDINPKTETQQENESSHHAPSDQASQSSSFRDRAELHTRLARPRTFVRPSLPVDLLVSPVINSRDPCYMKADIFITSPFHIAGGSVAGKLNISTFQNADLQLGRVAIDLVGIEEYGFGHQKMFIALAAEFIDDDHPPPSTILRQGENSGPFWSIRKGEGAFPFDFNLPLDVGPGTFDSGTARIRYVIYGTILFKIGDKKFLVRCCRDVAVAPSLGEFRKTVTDFDREVKVFEERNFVPEGSLKLTANLSRPYWFSGGSAFVDVLVENETQFRIKTIRVRLVRRIDVYPKDPKNHPTPATLTKTMARSELNAGSRWTGLTFNKQDAVTCEIDIPKGQLTIPLGRYFEVQYFIVVTTCPKLDPHRRKVKAVLPIRVLHKDSIHEALMSGIGNKPSFASFSAMRRSLPFAPQRLSTSTSTNGTVVRRRYTDSDLSQVEPIPITEAGHQPTNHVTSGTATPPKVDKHKKREDVEGANPDDSQASSSRHFYSFTSHIPSVRSYFSKA
ncbi:hypothetical protein TWF788_005124 [Orbilia oligospora]|uniref:Arrestin C-terminal-like domain-containing protein n=1 Tax=Orbilia oligospora TaxID=2813651 RepID=A0A7C8JZC1_ORBOL|nr:hypothetical protein TWF788_005124 [Orbilia oligospora]